MLAKSTGLKSEGLGPSPSRVTNEQRMAASHLTFLVLAFSHRDGESLLKASITYIPGEWGNEMNMKH